MRRLYVLNIQGIYLLNYFMRDRKFFLKSLNFSGLNDLFLRTGVVWVEIPNDKSQFRMKPQQPKFKILC
jgi:hypothetical protein